MDQANGDAGGGEDAAGGWIHPSTLERRASKRFTVLDHRAWLGWWGDRSFEVVEVNLLDLSRGGALFEMEKSLTEDQTVLLGLETLREDSCLTVKVVRIRRGRRKKHRVHVAFTEACLDEFYAAALNGPAERGASWCGESQPIPLPQGPDETPCLT